MRDQDADGLYDGWETQRGLNPSQADATLDSDGDGLNNQSEFLKQLHPKNADTDGDGQSDGLEVSGGSNARDWYERKGNNGLEHVVADVPGDFDSLQEAVHHIVHTGAVTLTAPVVNANMLLDGKSLQVYDLGGGSADPDGSPTDAGCYGGATGGRWDRDLDGLPEYFWPGTYADAPAGVTASDFDGQDTP